MYRLLPAALDLYSTSESHTVIDVLCSMHVITRRGCSGSRNVIYCLWLVFRIRAHVLVVQAGQTRVCDTEEI